MCLNSSKTVFLSWRCIWFLIVVFVCSGCWQVGAISNARFNSNIREFANNSNPFNSSDVKTLQKRGRISDINRKFHPTSFKGSTDSQPSSSSHGRGFKFFPQGDFTEHGTSGYDDGYDIRGPSIEHLYPEPEYHEPYHIDHGHGHGNPYYDRHHALAVKSFLIPLAGIALLGAAAALATNPVLLQLGVISGRRRRRRNIQQLDHQPPYLPMPPLSSHVNQNLHKSGLHHQERSHSGFNPRDGMESVLNQITPIPYLAKLAKQSTTLPRPYSMSTTPKYDRPLLQRSWLEEPLERPGVVEFLNNTYSMYNTGSRRQRKMLP